MPIPTADEQYWRAYTKSISSQLGQPGDNEAVFVAPPNERGIAGGPWIPEAVTNNLIYHCADNLLPPNSPLYYPGGEATYSGMLRQYLEWVEISSNTNDGAKIRLYNAKETLDTARENYNYERKQLKTQYAEDPFSSEMTLKDWTYQNAQSYLQAQSQYNSASGAYGQALRDYYGPDATQVNEYRQRLTQAYDTVMLHKGINMPCTAADINNINDLFRRANRDPNANPQTGMEGASYMPLYSIQGYSSTVNGWVNNYKKNSPQVLRINLEDGKSTRWEDLGFSEIRGDARGDMWCVFSAHVGGSSSKETRNLQLDENKSQVSAEIRAYGMQKFPIAAGSWDVPGVKKMYPKLREGAPEGLKDLVRPTGLLLAYGVELVVTFSQDVRDKVDNLLKEAKNAQGSVNVFGFCIGSASASMEGSKSRQVTFDQTQWNKESGTLTIPGENNGYPTLMGVVGRRL